MSTSSAGEADLIVVGSEAGEALMNCLQSIDAQSRPPSRVIILDNASHQPFFQRLPKNLLKVPYLIMRNDTNLGLAGAINRAMTEVQSPFVAWISADMVLADKWLEKLLPAVGAEGKIAGVQSIILRDKTTVDSAGISVETGLFRQIGLGQKLTRLKQVSQPWGISAAAALFRTHAVTEVAVGGSILQSGSFTHYEDVDLSARLRTRGWKFKLVPEALAMRQPSLARGGRVAFRTQVRNRYHVIRAYPETGKVSALVGDDLENAVRELLSGRFQWAVERLRGVSEGLRRRR